MSDGPYRVVSGNYKDRPDHAMSYWKIEPDVGLPRLAMRHVVERQCDACNRAFAAGAASRPASGINAWIANMPGPKHGKPGWQAPDFPPGSTLVINQGAGNSPRVCIEPADRPSVSRERPAPDVDAIAREAADRIDIQCTSLGIYWYKAATIIREAIEKALGHE